MKQKTYTSADFKYTNYMILEEWKRWKRNYKSIGISSKKVTVKIEKPVDKIKSHAAPAILKKYKKFNNHNWQSFNGKSKNCLAKCVTCGVVRKTINIVSLGRRTSRLEYYLNSVLLQENPECVNITQIKK